MFNWSKPRCPVDKYAKFWIEQRLLWLAQEFSPEPFLDRPPILPHRDFFPGHYDMSDESIRALLEQVCGYMQVDPRQIELQFFDDRTPLMLVDERGYYLPTTAGLYEPQLSGRTVIHLEESQIADPMLLVGTMAHELAHVRLLGEERIDPEIFDNELLTDLTVVFLGMGIFLANIPRAWKSDEGFWPDTNVRRPEYMTLPMYAYALAHVAWIRNEQKPPWMKSLNLDARCFFKDALRFLQATGDSAFTAQRLGWRPKTEL